MTQLVLITGAALVWLLSNDAAWVTGQVLPVDGGFTAVRPMVRG